MNKKKSQSLLRIYLSSSDKDGDRPLYESIVETAHKEGVAGATVLKGIFGYRPNDKDIAGILTEKKDKFPIVIEIVDNYEIVMSFFEKTKSSFNGMTKGCLITIEHLDVLLYK